MYLVFTRMPGESYRRRLGSLLYVSYAFRALITCVDTARVCVCACVCVRVTVGDSGVCCTCVKHFEN